MPLRVAVSSFYGTKKPLILLYSLLVGGDWVGFSEHYSGGDFLFFFIYFIMTDMIIFFALLLLSVISSDT